MTKSALLVVSLVAYAAAGFAQEHFPSRPVTLIEPFPPGGFVDLTARPLAASMEKFLKQPVVVSNRPGASGAIGTALVANAKPDGYNALITASTISMVPEADKLFDRKPAYTLNQFAPIALIWTEPTYLIVRSESPWKSVKELVADARQRQGQLSYSSSGLYGVLHIPFEMFAVAAGIKMRHLPTNGGGPALTALLGGHVDMTAAGPATLTPHIKSGKIRALAGWGAKRHELLPDIPTFMELGYNIEYYTWVALFAPVETPEATMKVLRDAVHKSVEDPDFKATMVKLNTPLHYLDAPEFQKFWDSDAKRIAEVIKGIGRVEEKK
ncbi:MAG TPA: tripartite tricarboxylate transporter substrate binding protein [Burkholderiales bacterium]|nr:tripartite tricarboxylate transporter substrate binding protein [Burkholderiales bacterium]